MRVVGPSSIALVLAVLCLGPAFADTVTLTGPLDSRNCTTAESSFGDLVADSILAAAPQASIAIVTADETPPTVIPPGKTDSSRIVSALRDGDDPNDTIAILKIKGSTLRDAIVHGLSRAPSPFDGFLQVSGLRVRFDSSRSGPDVLVSLETSTGQSIDPTAVYPVAMPSYVASGALGYFSVWPDGSGAQTIQVSVGDAVRRLIDQRHTLSCQTDGRISGQ